MRSHVVFIVFFVAFTIFSAVNTARALEYNPTDSTELQAALAKAGSNEGDDTILLAPGVYRGNFRYEADEANALTIKPKLDAPPGSVVLDGENNAFVLQLKVNGYGANIEIEGLTIRNGASMEHGGGIYAIQSGNVGTLTISDCNIKDNSANNSGGGAYLVGFEKVWIENSIVDGNSAKHKGGGVYCNSCELLNNTISGNTVNTEPSLYLSYAGGGVYCNVGLLENNTISGNTLVVDSTTYNVAGGGVYCEDSVLDNNTISGNAIITEPDHELSYTGGGVAFEDSVLTNNIIKDNSDGVYFFPGNVIFKYNTVMENSDYGLKGGTSGDTLSILSNLICSNGGVGASFVYKNLTLTNNTIALNGDKGLDLVVGSSSTTNLYNNIIWGNQGSADVYLSAYGDESNSFNNIYTSVVAFWNNEGGNQTIDPLFHDPAGGDFHAIAGSPAIDKGLNTAPGLPPYDLDGNDRVVNGAVDIGAYERYTDARHPADLNENWIIEDTELKEFTNYNNAWRNNNDWVNGPNPIPMSYVTRAGYLLQKGGGYQNTGVGKPACWTPSD